MTPAALSYLSGPAAVEEVTGSRLSAPKSSVARLSMPAARAWPLCSRATMTRPWKRWPGCSTSFPAHSDELAPAPVLRRPAYTASTPEFRDVVPASSTGSYDVRRVSPPSPTMARRSNCGRRGHPNW